MLKVVFVPAAVAERIQLVAFRAGAEQCLWLLQLARCEPHEMAEVIQAALHDLKVQAGHLAARRRRLHH